MSYHGWVGHNNIGDEAIYTACRNMFDECHLVQSKYIDDNSTPELFGGGTIWPPSRHKKTESLTAGIGVGVIQPKYRNRKYSKIDIGYYLNKMDHGELLDKKSVNWLLRPANHLFDSVTIKNHCVRPEDYKILNEFEYVGVRGPLSKQILNRYGIESTITGDTALILEPDSYESANKKQVAITLRDGGHKWSNSNEYIKIIENFCHQNSERYQFIFLPLKPSDIPLHIQLTQKVSNSIFIDHCTTPDVKGVINQYSKCDFVISERLHGNVLSACSYTPFISIEYRPKNKDFSKSLDMKKFNIKNKNLSVSKIDNLIGEIRSRDIQSDLQIEVDQKRKKIRNFTKPIIKSFT